MKTMTNVLKSQVLTENDFPSFNSSNVTSDIKLVKPGDIYVALKNKDTNGEDFIQEAIAKGAKIIVASHQYTSFEQSEITLIKTENPYKTLSMLAKQLYPRQPDTTVAITGTNGKSSVAHFLRHLWGYLGYTNGSIGTLGTITHKDNVEHIIPLYYTSPPALKFHELLNSVAESNVTHCIFEATAHDLREHRITGAEISAAGLTHFSQAYNPCHTNMDTYFNSTVFLFEQTLPPGKTAVLNADIPEFEMLKKICLERGCPVLSYGEHGDLCLKSRTPNPLGQHVTLTYKGSSYECDLNFVGLLHVQNALCALGLALSCGAPIELLIQALPTLPCVTGRLELLGTAPNGAPIYMDEAHTPDGLQTVLKALKPHTPGHLHVVFGCEGDQDPKNRPLVGTIAHEFADVVYITNDNPRTENPDSIRQQIFSSILNALDIADRRACILQAINNLAPTDVLLVTGKEYDKDNRMCIPPPTLDDKLIVEQILKDLTS